MVATAMTVVMPTMTATGTEYQYWSTQTTYHQIFIALHRICSLNCAHFEFLRFNFAVSVRIALSTGVAETLANFQWLRGPKNARKSRKHPNMTENVRNIKTPKNFKMNLKDKATQLVIEKLKKLYHL